MNYQPGNASLFATAAREAKIEFPCAIECKVGAYALQAGDMLTAVSDGFGLFNLYVEWADGCMGRFRAGDINKLAGWKVAGG